NQGEYIFQLQQLIKTAGKRNKEIHLAILNHQLSELEFNNLLRTLFYQLHFTFYQLSFLEKNRNIFQTEINELEPLVKEYENQFEKGNVSLKEVFRLRGLLFNIQSITAQIKEQIADLRKDLSVYTQTNFNENTVFVPDTIHFTDFDKLNILSLIDTAIQYRPDYLNQKKYYEYATLNYNYQKALSVPDLQLGYTFDKAGNFIMNYSALSLGLNLPVFNRNQGNIKAAQFLIKQSETDIKQKEQEIRQEILNAYQKIMTTKNLYDATQKDFLKNFDNIKDGMRENFKKRNISILEYADFFDAYINTVQQYYALLTNYYTQIETLNFYIGKKIIK
ncbi:MAG: TolC family protein, partial [Candidatus Micrarchaeota archaeon]|nr:TolC family protein [Candidatus Micrarchaeota archaeon]